MISSYKQMTIKTYQEMVGIINQRLPQFNSNLELYILLSGKDRDKVMAMPIPEFKEALDGFGWVATAYKGNLVPSFTLDGKEYLTTWRLQDITAAQFIDLSTFTKDIDMINDNLHKICAVLCIEKGKKYSGDGFGERAELFKEQLTMDIVFPLSDFFLNLWRGSLPLIQSSLDSEIQKNIRALEQMLPQDS